MGFHAEASWSATCSMRRILCCIALLLPVSAISLADEPRRIGEPYELLGKRLVFTNWTYVRPGDVSWLDPASGGSVNADDSVKMGPFAAKWSPSDLMPWGVKIKALPPEEIRKWVIQPEFPWEGKEVYLSSIAYDEGKYKGWGGCQAGNCYLESEDGMKWTRPRLGLVDYGGNKENNLIPSLPSGRIFIDPSSTEERYKTLWVEDGGMTYEQFLEYQKKYPEGWGPNAVRTVYDPGIDATKPSITYLVGAVSRDGFHWQKLEEPILVEHCDTDNIGYYDPRRGKYVGYVRTWNALLRAPSMPVEEK